MSQERKELRIGSEASGRTNVNSIQRQLVRNVAVDICHLHMTGFANGRVVELKRLTELDAITEAFLG